MEFEEYSNLRKQVENRSNEFERSMIKSWLDHSAQFNLPVPSQALSQTLEDLSVIKLARNSRALLPL
jgi:hypothetical protein